MHLSYILLTLTSFSTCLALDPWYFTWTDPTNKTHSESASTPDTCFKIDNPIGKYFDWTAGDGWCIDLWENTNCTGSADAGHTCKPWPWRAVAEHHHLRSFRVVVNGSDSTSPSASPSASPSSAGSGDGAGSDGSLSGGAIAGIVIGVVAGVAILAVAAWFLFIYRRRQKFNPTELDPLGASDATDKKETGTTLAEMPHTPVDKPSELMGDSNMRVEISDTSRVAELDGTGINQR